MKTIDLDQTNLDECVQGAQRRTNALSSPEVEGRSRWL